MILRTEPWRNGYYDNPKGEVNLKFLFNFNYILYFGVYLTYVSIRDSCSATWTKVIKKTKIHIPIISSLTDRKSLMTILWTLSLRIFLKPMVPNKSCILICIRWNLILYKNTYLFYVNAPLFHSASLNKQDREWCYYWPSWLIPS